MFGLNEAMLSFLRRQVGLRTDSADAAGSLHAKIGGLRSYLAANYFRLRSATAYYHTRGVAPEKTETTFFSCSGSGVAIMQETVSANGASSVGGYFPSTELRIYVDGTLMQTIYFGTIDVNTTVTKTEALPFFIFSTSFAVKGKVGDNPGTVYGVDGNVIFTYGLSCFVES